MTNDITAPDEQPTARAHAARQQELLFKTLFGGLTGYMGLFSSVAGAKKDSDSVEVLRMRAGYFAYPAQVPQALHWAEHAAGEGRELHLCPHLLTRERRVKENAGTIRALWADADDAELPEGFPEPTISVQSSPGNRHLYWVLRKTLEPEQAENYNRRLTYTIGADPGGWPLAALMRLPGTNNRKYPGHTPIGVLSHDIGLAYHPREIEQYLIDNPHGTHEEQETIPMSEVPDIRPKNADGTLLTVDDLDKLSPNMRELIAMGNTALGKPYKSRSEADFAVVIAMLGRGFEEEAINEVLRNPSNGISEAYQSRGRFGEQYLRITIREAKKKGQRPYPAASRRTQNNSRRHTKRKPHRSRRTSGDEVS